MKGQWKSSGRGNEMHEGRKPGQSTQLDRKCLRKRRGDGDVGQWEQGLAYSPAELQYLSQVPERLYTCPCVDFMVRLITWAMRCVSRLKLGR